MFFPQDHRGKRNDYVVDRSCHEHKNRFGKVFVKVEERPQDTDK